MPDRPGKTPEQKNAGKKTPAGRDQRRGPTGMRSIAAPLSAVGRPVLKRRGLAGGRIVAEWPEIVGASLAACSCPERLSQPRDGGPGVLKIRVDGPLAIELQHLEPVVIERINGYFGYRAVERLSMVRGPLPPRRDDVPAAPPAADAAALQKAADRTAGIEDEALREALTSLGGHVLSRGRGSAPR
ncbi:MAG: DciA family protein [Alphaproteobacteria bacterium]|nr:DciA family protein [Alphaproteobacteria bacterium]